MNGDELRDGIFALQTRRFGAVAEALVQRLLALGIARNQFHDLFDERQKHRVEVKFSVARRRCETRITPNTVSQCIAEARTEERMMAFDDWPNHDFDCNHPASQTT